MKTIKIVHSKNSFFLLPIITLLLCFTSCTKDGTLLKGRVLENGSELPLEGVEVEIIGGKATGLFEPEITFSAGTAVTGKDGRFTICADDADYYRVGNFTKDRYFEILDYNINDPKKLAQTKGIAPSGANSNPDFYLDPKGTLHVVVENDPNVVGGFIAADFPTKPTSVKTTTGYEEFILVRANRFNIYAYTIDQKHSESVVDSIFCIPFDTTELKIVF